MGISVFESCLSLTSICIPPNVETIPNECFCECKSLVQVSFEHASKLTQIEDGAFLACQSLRSFVIPSQLEIMACCVFPGCRSLCSLIFDLPSHLTQLDLPPSEFGSLCIPDSVEIVFGGIGRRQGQSRRLHFSGQSCPRGLSLRGPADPWTGDQNSDTESDSFVHLPEGVLWRFRIQFEHF
jgi:hypothetical protein